MQLKTVGVFLFLLKREDRVAMDAWDHWRDLEEAIRKDVRRIRNAACMDKSQVQAQNRCRCSPGFSASLRTNMQV
jgi:hypothetical protein